MGDGAEPIADKEELKWVRRGAYRGLVASMSSAVFATLLFLIPA